MCEPWLATKDQLTFAIFCIETTADHPSKDPRDVYRALAEKTNLLDDHIARYYDALHTQDLLYVTEEIERELAAEGVSL